MILRDNDNLCIQISKGISKTGNSLCRLCAAVDTGDVSVVLDAGR